jgi:predicted short-subunit dehydrogenase-like oxidoreductase (DUF2520 family)
MPSRTALGKVPPPLSFAVVGPGRVGTALATALARSGGRGILVGLRPPTSRAIPDRLEAAAWSGLSLRSPDVLFIAVPDDLAPAVVKRLAATLPRPRRGAALFTVGGGGALALLAPLERAGWSIGRFHPVAPFPAPGSSFDWHEVPVAVEGKGPARRWAAEVGRMLDARPFFLPAGGGGRYHLGLSLAAAGVVSILAVAEELLVEAGVAPRLARRLASGLAVAGAESWSRKGAKALTGAVARGDAGLVGTHLAEAGRRDGPLVRLLWSRALPLAEEAGLPAPRARLVRKALSAKARSRPKASPLR